MRFRVFKGFFMQTFIPVLLLWSIASVAFAYPVLNHYSALSDALAQGHEVRAILQLGECHTESKHAAKMNDHRGGMNFTQFNQYAISQDGKMIPIIATSVNMLVHSEKYGPVFNYVRLRVLEDGRVTLLSEFLQPQNYSVLSTTTFECNINKGITLYDITAK